MTLVIFDYFNLVHGFCLYLEKKKIMETQFKSKSKIYFKYMYRGVCNVFISLFYYVIDIKMKLVKSYF